jgi:ferric-dicitrate binding protein FerR (iron transport regulator)
MGKAGMASSLVNAPKEFLRLFKQGKDAARAGDKAAAHEFFRRAIEVDPYHEQVWLWLASVVETDEDRRVCFENVLELNPNNATAQRQLEKMEQRALQAAMGRMISKPEQKPQQSRRLRRGLLVLLIVACSVLALVAWSII